MVWIPGGSFVMGDNPQYPEEGPPQTLHVDGFWISNHEVTISEFQEFVSATGYVTGAEKTQDNVSSSASGSGGSVYTGTQTAASKDTGWWQWREKANWRVPDGRKKVDMKGNLTPVVQINREDAIAYANWLDMELPTEIQWEYAAGTRLTGSEPISQDGDFLANYYQGTFPLFDNGLDGFTSTAPVGCFEPNEYGLYDMIGNVWEWTSDSAPNQSELSVIKGGSYLCAKNYCARYRSAAKQYQENDIGAEHLSFRVVDNLRGPPRNSHPNLP